MKKLAHVTEFLKRRRQQLNLNQKDMLMKVGMSQQQYQRIEAGGDLRLSTLLRVLEGMDLELVLVPRQKVAQVEELLHSPLVGHNKLSDEHAEHMHNEWLDILGHLEEES
ncbi:transcriptional regulator [Hafnia psychrotolerans]|uniref:Transcriptional regulator n=2 Tax=Hafnia psychrotolerans TaxID=1477018 RepID=A0ABQ1GPQ2_9GAMM|nr:transcriptional regulator [Hafnia psychrotolerans]